MFALIAAVIVSIPAAQGQTVPDRGASMDVEPPESVPAAESRSPSPCRDNGCDDEPLFTFPGWMRHPHLCPLFGQSSGPRQIPWANWSACPLSVGCFGGVMNGGPLVDDWVGAKTGFNGGWRLGWEVNPAWGTEMRFAFGSLALYDSYRADQALIAQDNADGLAQNDPQRQRFDHRNADLFQWDVDIVYYFWRETRWRPYLVAGMGLTDISFTDRLADGYHDTCLSLPLGIGLKYLCEDNFAVRLDLLDDIAMSNTHLQTEHNLSLTAGLELRFGGSRKVYWPWDLGRSFW